MCRCWTRLSPLIAGMLVAVLVGAGCNSNPFAPASGTSSSAWQAPNASQPYDTQIADLTRRATQLDTNNRDLHAQLAASQQQVQVVRDQVSLVQKRLDETAQQLKETQVARQEIERQYETLQASLQRQGNAVITANSSIRQQLGVAAIPGVDVRQDQDLIRIDLPSDQLFVGGSTQLQPTAYLLIDQVATAVLREYPRQRIGIEGHTDAGVNPNLSPSNLHQLTAAQAAAVLDQLLQRNKLPAKQLFTAAHGSNYPRLASTTNEARAKNRRIEVVIYPETF
ncbi:MAG: flagellar motor protein MotB [Planctomycetota bacterium]